MDLILLIAELLIALVILSIVFTFCIIAFTTGFKPSGRQMGGISTYFGRQGQGKTYVAAALGLETMRNAKPVFSNFPIISVDRKYCSLFWEKKLMKENIRKCMLIWDEMQRDFWGRKFAAFTDEDLAWFTSIGQKEITLCILTQDIDNLDPVLKRVTDTFVEVSKIEIPFLEIPIMFVLREFKSLKDYIDYQKGIADPWHVERMLFNLDIANSYNTKFFVKSDKPIFQGITWIALGKKQKPPIEFPLPEDYALTTKIKRYISKVINSFYEYTKEYARQKGWNVAISAVIRQGARLRNAYGTRIERFLKGFIEKIREHRGR